MTKVLLYSGGMDSEAARQLWAPDRLLYVDMKTRYSAAERTALLPSVEVVELPLDTWERPDGIIPMRNLLLVALASMYGTEVGLAATAGDRVLDKNPTFAAMASKLLTYLWKPQHWTEGKTVEVVLPVKHLTKRGLVEAVASLNGPDGVAQLAASFSCYDPEPGECGRCKPCTRKWVAFAAAGHTDLLEPWGPTAREEVRRMVLPAIATSTWNRGGGEVGDVLAAFGCHNPEHPEQAAAHLLRERV